jgi:phage terminase small subunit
MKKPNMKSLVKITHGGFSYLRIGIVPPCKVCLFGLSGQCPKYKPEANDCKLILKLQDKKIKKIMSMPHIRPTDIMLVEEMIKDWGFLQIVDKWLSVIGPFQDKAGEVNPQAILKLRWTAANAMHRLADSLGLSPASRVSLKLEVDTEKDFGREIMDVGKEEKE